VLKDEHWDKPYSREVAAFPAVSPRNTRVVFFCFFCYFNKNIWVKFYIFTMIRGRSSKKSDGHENDDFDITTASML